MVYMVLAGPRSVSGTVLCGLHGVGWSVSRVVLCGSHGVGWS